MTLLIAYILFVYIAGIFIGKYLYGPVKKSKRK